MRPIRFHRPRVRWSSRLAGLAGIVASASTLSLVTLPFWNASRHAVDGPGFIARMQHCDTVLDAGARQRCIDQAYAWATGQGGDGQVAAWGRPSSAPVAR